MEASSSSDSSLEIRLLLTLLKPDHSFLLTQHPPSARLVLQSGFWFACCSCGLIPAPFVAALFVVMAVPFTCA